MKAFPCLFCAATMVATGALWAQTLENVTLHKPVTGYGVYGVGGRGGPLAGFETITDGVYFPEGHPWDTNTVWWDARRPESSTNFLVIELGGQYGITRLIVQADDNDTYAVDYWRGSGWSLAWQVPRDIQNVITGLWTRVHALDLPIETTRLRFRAESGDMRYSISELEALGYAVPEPGSAVLMLLPSLLLLAALRGRVNQTGSD